MICESDNVAVPGTIAILMLRNAARRANATIGRAMADTSDSPLHVKHSFRQGGASRIFLAFLAAVAALAGAEFYALWQSYHSHAPATAAVQQKVAAASTEIPRQPLVSPEIVGWVDEPIRETVVGDLFKTNGWALAKAGIRDVGLRVDGRSYPARYGLPRPDVAAQKPGFPDGAASGFSFEGTLADLTPVRHEIEYVATDTHGNTHSFGRKSLAPPAEL